MFGASLCLLMGMGTNGKCSGAYFLPGSLVSPRMQMCETDEPTLQLPRSYRPSRPARPAGPVLPVRSSRIRASLVGGLHDLEAWSHSADAKREIL